MTIVVVLSPRGSNNYRPSAPFLFSLSISAIIIIIIINILFTIECWFYSDQCILANVHRVLRCRKRFNYVYYVAGSGSITCITLQEAVQLRVLRCRKRFNYVYYVARSGSITCITLQEAVRFWSPEAKIHWSTSLPWRPVSFPSADRLGKKLHVFDLGWSHVPAVMAK